MQVVYKKSNVSNEEDGSGSHVAWQKAHKRLCITLILYVNLFIHITKYYFFSKTFPVIYIW